MRWIAFPNGIRPAKRLRISARHLARREGDFDVQQLLVENFDNGSDLFLKTCSLSGSLRLVLKNIHDFTDKTQIAHIFTYFRPLGGICLEKASRDVGLLGGELVDRCVFCQRH